ncbi:GGDEF domain-containing protein [Enterovibrio nigricans]|uniref:diguanylate cyclase n=1 Tax=Enterovibrio nigricans DSM 22720 TaxID=1121868 RepID=A0A1T4U248_9GAMM|nr:sensor domain-containing diguanylate cyclase [Enterovibrio nigricans]PKF51170.1 PAS domain S-box protein [Enterovibrio nigricans]SKA46710.1 diguanylate cyclase (GGDEF) domain-containing protein [Enterovibrio nigricans DSM 22720]
MPNFKDILDIHPNPCVIHINFVPQYANNAFARFSGLETAEDVLKLESIRVLFEEAHWPEAQRRYQRAIETGEATPPEVINHIDMKGNPMIAQITDKVVDWYGEKAMCTFISVVTDQVRREHTLRDMANRDDLTNLFNRRYLSKQFEQFQHSSSSDRFLAMVDIDHFKRINDNWGHPVGDLVLRQVAKIIEAFSDPGECASRLGGEEFALLFWGCNEQQAIERLEALRQEIEHIVVRVSHTTRQPLAIKCTVSIGATRVEVAESFLSASLRADESLYTAKNSGRNRLIYNNDIKKMDILDVANA